MQPFSLLVCNYLHIYFLFIYRNFSYSVKNYKNNKKDDPIYDYPTVEEGYRGMRFIDAVIDSSKNSKWIKI